MKFSDKEKALAIKQVQSEWNTFQVPEVVHSRIKELFWEHVEREETVKILMMDFGMKECYARKCYYFSEANQVTRERYAKIGMHYNCAFCNEQCVPDSIR